jgi:hypothetical protein
LRNRVLLQHDLDSGVRNPQHREDGSWAGWWVPLQQQNTSMLLVPSDRTTLIHSLEPTWWKPLSLDATVIPFGRAGDPNCAQRVIQVLQERQFVDQGEWAYTPPPTGFAIQRHIRAWDLMTGAARRRSALQQARVFQAMNLHNAAIRVLVSGFENRANGADLEIARCRKYLEWNARLTGNSTPESGGVEP